MFKSPFSNNGWSCVNQVFIFTVHEKKSPRVPVTGLKIAVVFFLTLFLFQATLLVLTQDNINAWIACHVIEYMFHYECGPSPDSVPARFPFSLRVCFNISKEMNVPSPWLFVINGPRSYGREITGKKIHPDKCQGDLGSHASSQVFTGWRDAVPVLGQSSRLLGSEIPASMHH